MSCYCCCAMASLLKASSFISPLHQKLNYVSLLPITTTAQSKLHQAKVRNGRWHVPSMIIKAQMALEGDIIDKESVSTSEKSDYGVVSVHHVGILCENLEKSLDFYQNVLGLKINEARPHDKLPYRGAWLWVGSEMIHLMELPNPDPLTGRPGHGGRDRHTCIAIRDVSKLKAILDKAGAMADVVAMAEFLERKKKKAAGGSRPTVPGSSSAASRSSAGAAVSPAQRQVSTPTSDHHEVHDVDVEEIPASSARGEKRTVGADQSQRVLKKQKKDMAKKQSRLEKVVGEGDFSGSEGPSVWTHNRALTSEELRHFTSSEDKVYLTSLSTSAREDSALEFSTWMVRGLNLFVHTAERNTALEKENTEFRAAAEVLQKRAEEVNAREARMTDLENTLEDRTDKLENARKEVADLVQTVLDLKREREEWAAEKENLQTMLGEKDRLEKELEEARMALATSQGEAAKFKDIAEKFGDQQFENAIDQIRLLRPNVDIDVSDLFIGGVVDDNVIINPKTLEVYFDASAPTDDLDRTEAVATEDAAVDVGTAEERA